MGIPAADTEVDTAFFKWKAKAICMWRPLYGLIIGNVPVVINNLVI